MIGSIKGKIILKKEKFVLIEVNNIGYKIYLTPENNKKIKTEKEVFLFTYLHVREDIQNLYGFLTYSELELFEMLITVSGIGPKGALTILSIASTETLIKAIKTGDTVYLIKISGIGRKTAEKIILELRDKLGQEEKDGSWTDDLDALEALKSLGYSTNQAREALKKVKSDVDIKTKVKEALRILSNQNKI